MNKYEEIHEILYRTFEHGHFAAFRTVNAAGNQRNEIQFRLMNNVAQLRKKEDPDTKASVAADVKLIHATGWLTDESFSHIEKLLEES